MKLNLNKKSNLRIEAFEGRQLLATECKVIEPDFDATCENTTLRETTLMRAETIASAAIATIGHMIPVVVAYTAAHIITKATFGIDIHKNHKLIRNLIGIVGYELSYEFTHDVIRADEAGNTRVQKDPLYWIFKPSAEIVKFAENNVDSAQKTQQSQCLIEHSQPKSLFNNIIEILPVLGVIQILKIGFPHIEPIAVA